MARRPGKNGKSSTPMATTLIIPGAKVLARLLETKRVQGKLSANALGVYRQQVGDATEKDHLDKWAWSTAAKMAEMEDDELHVRYFHLLHYLEELGIVKRATAQEEMFAAWETGPAPKNGKGGDGDDEGDDTAKRIGATARKVAESAGASMPD